MRKIITLIFFVFTQLIYAQNDVLFVYIDASSSDDKLKEIIAEVQDIVDSKPNSDILLFISKGESPIITNERSEVNRTLRRLRAIFISSPDFHSDLSRINSELLTNNYISDISEITVNDGLSHNIQFHFYFDKTDYYSLQLEKQMIKPFLFSNNLKFKESLQENCSVYLHLGIKDDIHTPDVNEEEFETTEYK